MPTLQLRTLRLQWLGGSPGTHNHGSQYLGLEARKSTDFPPPLIREWGRPWASTGLLPWGPRLPRAVGGAGGRLGA